MYIPYDTNINNILFSLGLESLVILYQANKSAVPQLWNSNFTLISLFDTLAGNIKNIACYLLKIAAFIKQRLLGNKTVKYIPQIVDFSFVS